MILLKQSLAVLLCCTVLTCAQSSNVFTKVRYNGGSFPSKVDPKEWDNRLTVNSDMVVLELKAPKKHWDRLEIPAKSITSLSYGQEAHRRVGTMIALAILVAPVALFGLFHKTRLHYIGVQYKMPEGKTGGILLQGDKDNYRAMLVALQGVSGAPVSVAEKEREFIPVGLTTAVTKNADEPKTGEPTSTADASSGPEVTGTVIVETAPTGADVYVDDQFYGNGPATLKLKPGKHTVAVKMSGFKDWSRQLTTSGGAEAHLTATLEHSN